MSTTFSSMELSLTWLHGWHLQPVGWLLGLILLLRLQLTSGWLTLCLSALVLHMNHSRFVVVIVVVVGDGDCW